MDKYKFDSGKPNLSLVFSSFSTSLIDIGYIGTFGAKKYSPNGWKEVTDGIERYQSALLRHLFSSMRGDIYDKETGHLHMTHVAWNALALAEFLFKENNIDFDAYIKNCKRIEQEYFDKKGKESDE